jgi:hypothetical protein
VVDGEYQSPIPADIVRIYFAAEMSPGTTNQLLPTCSRTSSSLRTKSVVWKSPHWTRCWKRSDRYGFTPVTSLDADLQTINIILSDAIPGYLETSIRQSSYAAVKPNRLTIVLGKLAKGTAATAGGGSINRSERRRMEADQVGRLPNA